MKIFFYSFANTSYIFNEVVKLSLDKKLNIEWGMIYPRSIYKESVKEYIKKENIIYLYENFDKVYNENREIKFNDVKWIDNIYTIIESSKFGFKKEDSQRQLKVAFTIYTIYKDFLLKSKPDYVVFPDIETVNGVILLNICKELNIERMVTTHTRQLDYSFFAQDYRESLPIYFGTFNKDDLEKSESFINNTIKKAIIGNQITEQKIELKTHASLFKRMINSILVYYKYEKNGIFDTSLYLRIRLNFEKYFEIWREYYFNFYQKRFFHITSENNYIPQKYILFLLQVTPESSINTYSQYFIEQERAIDVIRLNMPSEYKLLIKEHPAMRGMRSNGWYRKMRKKAGVFLVSHKIDTKEMIHNSKMVATITGSVGLECYHFDKPVLLFGQTFFSHLLNSFDSLSKCSEQIKELLDNKQFDTKDKKIENIAKIYNIGYDFFIHEPFHFERVMYKSNIENFLDAILNHIQRLKEYSKNV